MLQFQYGVPVHYFICFNVDNAIISIVLIVEKLCAMSNTRLEITVF